MTTLRWEKQDNNLQHLSTALNGWFGQIWDFGAHPDNPPYPPGQPFHWGVDASMVLTDGPEREGYAATLDEAKATAEAVLRELAGSPAPHDPTLVFLAGLMAPHTSTGR